MRNSQKIKLNENEADNAKPLHQFVTNEVRFDYLLVMDK
jgi:hypothetical protein